MEVGIGVRDRKAVCYRFDRCSQWDLSVDRRADCKSIVIVGSGLVVCRTAVVRRWGRGFLTYVRWDYIITTFIIIRTSALKRINGGTIESLRSYIVRTSVGGRGRAATEPPSAYHKRHRSRDLNPP